MVFELPSLSCHLGRGTGRDILDCTRKNLEEAGEKTQKRPRETGVRRRAEVRDRTKTEIEKDKIEEKSRADAVPAFPAPQGRFSSGT